MKKTFLILSLTCLSFILPESKIYASSPTSHLSNDTQSLDSALNNILTQVLLFPQEKIYMQTDKPYYISGENMFFRIFLLNAFSHQPDSISRYAYVELINLADSVVIREKIRPDKNLFYGSLKLPEDLPQGNYKLRTYTRFMENIGEDYFFSQQVFIADPQSLFFDTETNFDFLNDKLVKVGIRYVNTKLKTPIVPDRITVRLNDNKNESLKPDKEGWVYKTFNLSEDNKKRSLYAELETDKIFFREYLQVPFPDTDFEVVFFPEGGNLLAGRPSIVALKALHPNGNPADVRGEVFDSKDNLVAQFSTIHDGMGSFLLNPVEGETYYTVCTDGNLPGRFALPEVKPHGYGIKAVWRQEKLWISIQKTELLPWERLFLVGHTGGMVVYAKEWNPENEFISLDKTLFPSGVSHFLLLSEEFIPLSERLVFNLNHDWNSVEIKPDKSNYSNREKVTLDISLNDTSEISPSDNIALSVTDDNEIVLDTTFNILTSVLLTSELPGYIPNPAFYFQKGNREAEAAADLLMLTHGWKRYDIPKAMRGDFSFLTIPNEESQVFSGIVKGGLLSKPYEGATVTVVSTNNGFNDITETDSNGRFEFKGFEFPDSTQYRIQALNKKGKDVVELYLDNINYPAVSPYWISPLNGLQGNEKKEEAVFSEYVAKAERKYVYENGQRIVNLPQVVVKGRQNRRKHQSFYHLEPDFSMSEEEIRRSASGDMKNLLRRAPGLRIERSNKDKDKVSELIRFRTHGGSGNNPQPPMIIVDGMRLSYSTGPKSRDPDMDNLLDMETLNVIDLLDIQDVEQVDFVRSPAKLAAYGQAGANGVIEIYTKNGTWAAKQKFNMQTITPLGYHIPKEFYSPKYDTKEAYEKDVPDLRSTIYWKPNAALDKNGKVSVDFYTTDSKSSYSITIEGVSRNGKLIYQVSKAAIKME